MSGERPQGRERRTPATWIRVAADKVPPKWVTVSAVALFLAGTAAFGGLADAPAAAEKPLAQLDPGDAHDTGELKVTLDRAVLIDTLDGSGTYPLDDGSERVLAVLATIENPGNEALDTLSFATDQIAVTGMPTERPDGRALEVSTARLDDATISPVIQPGFSVEIALTWPVPRDLWRADDELHLTISDLTWFEPTFLGDGPGFWTEPAVPAAEIDLVVEDVGAGVETEDAQ